MSGNSRKTLGFALLMWLLATVTIGMQSWLGDQTIYSQNLEQKREQLHFAILANHAPGNGSWEAVGALSIQKRIGVVYLAEGIREFSGMTVGKIYKLLDSIFLFIALVGLYFYLNRWVSNLYSLLGVLYFCAVLPFTYFFQLFHPWDRPQLAIWIGLFWLIANRRFLLLAVGLFISILVKFDTILLPFLYFLVHIDKRQPLRVCTESVALLMLAFGTYFALGIIFPAPLDTAGFDLNSARAILAHNAQALANMNVTYPPLLVHALPFLLSLLFLNSKPRFVVASIAFAVGLSAVYVTFSRYEEVRAHMVVLILVLPSALISLSRLIDDSAPLTRMDMCEYR